MEDNKKMINKNSSKLILLFSLLMILIYLAPSLVSAVECNADLSNAGNSCTVSSSLTLNGTYSVNINGSSSSVGAIQINGNNINFNCNQTEIYGNWSNSGNNGFIGIYINLKNNVTIQNCIVKDYNYGIRQRLSNNTYIYYSNFTENRMGTYLSLNNTNSTYSGNLFYNNSYAGIWIQDFLGNKMLVYNNTFYDPADGIREESTDSNFSDVNITNNIFYQNFTSTNIRGAITYIGGYDWKVNNNIIYGSKTTFSYGIDARGKNSSFDSNIIKNTQYGLSLTDAYNMTLTNNNISENDDPLILTE